MSQQTAQVLEAIRAAQSKISQAFLDAVAQSAGRVDFNELIARIEAMDTDWVIRELGLNQTFMLTEEIRRTFIAGALITPRGLSGRFAFDGGHPRAVELLERNGGELVTLLKDGQDVVIRSVLRAAMESNQTPAKTALELVGRVKGTTRVGGFLGLTKPQADSIIRSRALLESGDPKLMEQYLELKQRDRSYDGRVRAAIKAERPVRGIDTILAAHRRKALGIRGRNIARDQAKTSIAAGRDEAFTQIGDVPDVDFVTKRWQHNLSLDPRQDHVDMSGTVIRFDAKFDFGDVQMKHPHDPAGGAKHSLGCKCIAFYRVHMVRD